ncbi:MAG: F0F1 ATP synthase subunit A [Bacteroidota bacterium]
MRSWNLFPGLILAGLLSFGQALGLNSGEHSDTVAAAKGKAAFDPGTFIIEHVSDSYEWHILKVGKTHVSIPLPVILYTREKGLVCFMSSRFHHGEAAYKGFRIAEEGKNEGKIVQVKEDGSLDEEARLPIDLSITKTVFALIFSAILLLLIFLPIARKYKKQDGNKAPSGFQSLMEPVILFVRDEVAIPSIGAKRYEKFMPYLLTIFFFILINNLLGLIPIPPGGANVTGNIAITGILALITFGIMMVTSDKHYWIDVFNTPGVPWWLKIPVPLMPFIELFGMIMKPVVLAIRLFANILAGHFIGLSFIVLIFVFGQMHWLAGYGTSVIWVLFDVIMTMLEILVAFLQAYVFAMLSALYFGMAHEEHH